MKPFDPLLPPPCAETIIEASAGTGKTYSIASIYLHLILQGAAPKKILVVTFTEAATKELRDRLRIRLTLACRCAAAFVQEDTAAMEQDQEALLCLCLLRFYADKRQQSPQQLLRLLQDALLGFDEAAVFTINGFCQRVLADYAFECATAFDAELVVDEKIFTQRLWASYQRERLYGRNPQEALPELLPEALALQLLYEARRHGELFHSAPVLDDVIQAWRAACSGLAASKATALQLFDQERNTLIAGLWNGALKANVYNPNTMDTKLEAMRAWLTDPQTEDPGNLFDLLSVEKITKAKKNGQADPPRPAFSTQSLPSFLVLAEKLKELRHELSAAEMAHCARRLLELDRQTKRQERLLSFDDQIGLVHQALRDGAQREELIRKIRQHYHAALVDEFQDTDQRQYAIFHTLFGGSGKPLLMIGDPKQSIYGFRGADIQAYIQARHAIPPEQTFTLKSNFRTEARLGAAFNAFYAASRAPFHCQEIGYEAIEYAPQAKRTGLLDDPQGVLGGQSLLITPLAAPPEALGNKAVLIKLCAQACAERIRKLLAQDGLGFVKDGQRRPLAAGDIAVLVRKHKEAVQIQLQLRALGLPCVLQKTGRLFASREAQDLLILLQTSAQPQPSHVRAVLAGSFYRRSAADLTDLDEIALAQEADHLRGLHRRWRQQGILAALNAFEQERQLTPFLAGQADGERALINFQHLCETLHGMERELGLGPAQLLQHLTRACQAPSEADELMQRLESDEAAIRILTQHAAKGLEFPVVLLPFTWYAENPVPSQHKDQRLLSFINAEGRRCFVRASAATAEDEGQVKAAALQEEARLLYVGLTRAANLCLVFSADYRWARESALFQHFQADSQAALLQSWERARATIPAEDASALAPFASVLAPSADAAPPEAFPLPQRSFHTRHRIRSFSRLTDAAHHAGPDPSQDLPGGDEPRAERPADEASVQIQIQPQGPSFPGRANDFGTAVHTCFETLDFQAPESWPAALGRALRRQGLPHDEATLDLSMPLIRDTLCTPITDPADPAASWRLQELLPRDMVPEMEFHFLLRHAGSEAIAAAIAAARPQGQHADDPANFQAAAENIRRLRLVDLQGYMNGKADLIFRRQGRYYVLDWKTNALHQQRGSLAARVAAEMVDQHYILQYHIYTLALHLHLRRRLAGYSYERHFGGVIYPFVRFSADPAAFYIDRPPLQAIRCLATAFAGDLSHE